MNEYHDEMMKVKDAARYLQVSKALLYQLINRKEVPHIRLSERRIVIRKSDLIAWLEKRAYKC